ncbi:ATP-binding protein [Chryseobacterium indologenes]|uniref:ATP-binding protein n=1 Tax=Chryseobacterium indologenes TaxID=253 RepID=UPI0009A1A741|nr:ATP-binding protein [Chryseobacterium indologenes]
MSKRITSIAINNFRGYFGAYDSIDMPNGENMLVYGENGSGKSSLYKAINDFFASSRDATLQFIKNRYLLTHSCGIKLQFSDYDSSIGSTLAGTEVTHIFSDTSSDNNVLFIQNTALIKGFLDYTDLLKVYFHNEPEPNLFELIILNLLGDHIPHSTGGNFRFKERWHQLQNDLITNAYTRNDHCHRNAITFLPIFETHLKGTLDEVFTILNQYLSNYFSEFNIELSYILAPLNFNYGYKWEWNTTSVFKLKVIKDGVPIVGGYNDFLNEARLSAIAVCLYLASLRTNPTTVDLKILYLDDVFVGLDTANRIPILNILKNEFSDYQKFISTYDRHWFELAKKYFEINSSEKWKIIEMYVGLDTDPISNNKINKPIIIEGESNFDKATRYLNHRSAPDFPASANYFRKALEELIKEFIPKWETADAENTQIPDYQLTQLILRAKRFLGNSGNSTEYVDIIYSLLSALLHPLSHHEITSPLYRRELVIIQDSFIKLKEQFINLDIANNFKCCLEQGKRLKITYEIDVPTNHYCFYELILKDALTVKKNGVLAPVLSKVHCVADKCYGHNGTIPYPSYNPDKKNPNFNYESLQDAYDKIYNFLVATSGVTFPKLTDYLNTVEYHDGTNWQPMFNKVVW